MCGKIKFCRHDTKCRGKLISMYSPYKGTINISPQVRGNQVRWGFVPLPSPRCGHTCCKLETLLQFIRGRHCPRLYWSGLQTAVMGSDDDGHEERRAVGAETAGGERNDKRAPTSLGQEVRLLLQCTSSSFYIDDGNDFYFSSCSGRRGGLLCSNTYHLLQHLLYWDAPGHVPGPLPFFALHPQVLSSLPVFISPLIFQWNSPCARRLSWRTKKEDRSSAFLRGWRRCFAFYPQCPRC